MQRDSDGSRISVVKEKFKRTQCYTLQDQAEVTSLQALTVLYLFLNFSIVRLNSQQFFISSFSVVTNYSKGNLRAVSVLLVWQALCILVAVAQFGVQLALMIQIDNRKVPKRSVTADSYSLSLMLVLLLFGIIDLAAFQSPRSTERKPSSLLAANAPEKQVLEARIGCVFLFFRLLRFILRVIAYTILICIKLSMRFLCCKKAWKENDSVILLSVQSDNRGSDGADTP